MRKLIGLAILLVTFSPVNAQKKTLNNIGEVQKLSKSVMEKIKDGSVAEVFEDMRVYWPISDKEINDVRDQTVANLKLVVDHYGFIIGFERVKKEKISGFAFRETYILRYRNSALRFIFTYYKHTDGWILNGFKWDELFEQEFKAG